MPKNMRWSDFDSRDASYAQRPEHYLFPDEEPERRHYAEDFSLMHIHDTDGYCSVCTGWCQAGSKGQGNTR